MMDGIVLNQTALHAALTQLRDRGAEREDDGDSAAFFIDGLNVLAALLDPTHRMAAAAAGMRTPEAATASLRPSSQAGTPAPPTFHAPSLAAEESQAAHRNTLPDGPGRRDPAPCWTPSAEGDAPPYQAARTPEPPPDQAAEAPPPPALPRITRTPPPAPKRLWGITLTPAQEDTLRKLWHQLDVPAHEIRKALSAMDGPPVQSDATLYRLADKLGLRLRSVLRHEQQEAAEVAAAEDAATQAEAPAPEPAPTPPPARAAAPAQDAHGQTVRASAHVPTKGPLLPATQDSEKADAFACFDAGQTVRDVAADLGIPLSTLSNWHAEWKLRARKDAAA